MSGRKTVLLLAGDRQVPEIRGVHRLAGAILVQAIEDLRCGSGRKRLDALHWIEDPSEDQFSFVFCCRVLNRDPEEVRRFLERRDVPSWLFAAGVSGSSSVSA